MDPLTPSQQRAVDSNALDICVSAGAGAGKTRVLVDRFLRLATGSGAESAGVDRVLVITFTDRAAREMKQRIVMAFTDAGMVDERRRVETAWISTIHGFCSRLLQENPFEAGIDPAFRVLTGPQAKRLLQRCAGEALDEALVGANKDDLIRDLVYGLEAEYGPDRGRGKLIGTVEMVLGAFRGAGRTVEELEALAALSDEQFEQHGVSSVAGDVLARLRSEAAALAATLPPLLPALSGSLLAKARAIADLAPELEAATGVAIARSLSAMAAAAKGAMRPRTGQPDHDAAFEAIDAIRTLAAEVRDLLAVDDETARAGARRSRAVAALAARTWHGYQDRKRETDVLDNEDLLLMAADLLETRPSVRARYRRHFRWLLVDEFQDTDVVQLRLVRALHEPEPGDGGAPPNGLFVVGDVRQSIYGFRNAEPDLFRDVMAAMEAADGGELIALSTNFRARRELLAAVNTIFAAPRRAGADTFDPLDPGADYSAKATASIDLLLAKGKRIGSGMYVDAEAAAIAAHIRDLVKDGPSITGPGEWHGKPYRWGDFAILLRSTFDIGRYEDALRRADIPFFVAGGGRRYYARTEVRDLVNVLTALDSPLDDLALASTLRSPFAGVSAETLLRIAQAARPAAEAGAPPPEPLPWCLAVESLLASGGLPEPEAARVAPFMATLEALRAKEPDLTVGGLLEKLIAATHYDARMLVRPDGRRRLANVRKLVQMAHQDPALSVREFVKQIAELEQVSEREGDAPLAEEAADAVTITTVHAAKGLEYPVVILADMHRPRRAQPDPLPFVADGVRRAIGARVDGAPDHAHAAIALRAERRDEAEALRVLYVALTRAREHLVLAGTDATDTTWGGLVLSTLGIVSVGDHAEVRESSAGVSVRVILQRAAREVSGARGAGEQSGDGER